MADWDPLVNDIFVRAIEAGSPAERSAILDRSCGDDAALRRKVEALLAAHDQAGTFLERPAPGLTDDRPAEAGSASTVAGDEVADPGPSTADDPAADARPIAEGPGSRIGPYRLIRRSAKGAWASSTWPSRSARPAQGGAEDHQARHGHRPGRGAVRGRAAGAGADGPSQHRQGLRRRGHRVRPAVLRHGAGQRRPDHRVLRPGPAHAPGAAGAVRAGLPGDPARAPEGDHPPRRQAVQRAGHDRRRPADTQGDRLRHRQGDRAAAHRSVALHPVRRDRRHAGIHEPRAGRAERVGRRHPQRRLLAGRTALRAADGLDAAGAGPATRGGLRRDPPSDPRGGAAPAERAAVGLGRGAAVDRRDPADRAREAPETRTRRARLDRDAGAGEEPDSAIRAAPAGSPRTSSVTWPTSRSRRARRRGPTASASSPGRTGPRSRWQHPSRRSC